MSSSISMQEIRAVQQKQQSTPIIGVASHLPTNDDEDQESGINELPAEIIIYIFDMLDTRSKMRVEAVCGRWKRIMVHYSWKTTTRFVASDILPHSNQKFLEEFKQAQVWMKKVGNLRMVRLLKKCAAHLQEVDLSGLASYTFFEHYWRIVLSRIPAGQLEYLDLSNIPMYYWDLQRVVERFADLKTVKLRNISSFYYCMEHFFAQCSLLETLDFGANILDTTSLQRLPPTLRSLNLSQCSEITGGVIEYNLNLVSTTCPKLECLELDLRNDESIVIGDGLHTALSNLKCLQKLVLRGKTTILDFGGLPHMPALKNLTKHQFYTLNDDLFRWIGECSQLETLHLLESYTWGKWYTGNGLLHLKNLRQLKCLGLVAKKLTDVCLMAIANSNPELQAKSKK
uniref:F-box domain-containing protein n=1 Tax=Ditylenchus dipsaci TaxID=166011 RepID=A0A915EAJ4_9BILA